MDNEYEILTSFMIGDNTVAVVGGNGNGLVDGIFVYDQEGTPHKLISVGMPVGGLSVWGPNSITALIEGDFTGNRIYCQEPD